MKFRTRILLCMVWLLALALGVGGTMLIQISFQDALGRERESLLRSYRITVSVLETALADPGDAAMEEIAVSTFSQMQGSMEWHSAGLRLNDADLYRKGTLLSQDDQAIDPGSCVISLLEELETGHYLRLNAGITVDDERLMVTLVRDISEIYMTRDAMLSAFRWVFLITLGVGGLISFLLTAALTSPLGKVSRAARKMADGDLSVRLNLRSGDEVGQLSRDFDHMAGALQSNITAMEETMAAQERFMGSFAHELKTPMTSIIGYADLLRTQALDPADAQEAANYIFSEGKRLESLSLKLLQLHLSRHEPPEREKVDMARFLTRLTHQLRPVYEKEGIRLDCRTQPGTWPVDPELMESVVTNLMDNARKAMDRGGVIGLLLDYPDNTCRIRIVDNGRGMPPEVLKHLTEAFYRVDKSRSRAQGGAGLGLSLCNEIVQCHNGVLKFDSVPGKGTCVSVILKGGAE